MSFKLEYFFYFIDNIIENINVRIPLRGIDKENIHTWVSEYHKLLQDIRFDFPPDIYNAHNYTIGCN